MSNATMPSQADFETPVEQTLELPPLAIHRVGDKADFVLQETAIVKDDDGEDRIYYRALLLADFKCQTKEKGSDDYEDITFKAGKVVTIPASGGLIYQMGRLANKKAGVELNNENPKWAVLVGDRFIIERLADEKMAKGKHKGKAVKTFKLSHAPRKK